MVERKKSRKLNNVVVILLCTALIFLFCSIRTWAAGGIDINANVSMSLQYTGKKGHVANASFHVYHVADVTADGNYMVKDVFQAYPINLVHTTQESWQQLATTLKGYIWKDNIPKFDTGKTDANGVLTFPSEGVSMKPGLYLVIGDARTIGYYTYYATPFFVCLPGLNEQGIQNKYHAAVVPKYSYDYDPPSDPKPSTISRKVMKVWNDTGNEASRPETIHVYLYCDGKEYEKTQLNYRNNWRHTWSGLERGHDWTVVEEQVNGYTVYVTQEGVTFVVTNTYQPEPPKDPEPPEKPEIPEKPDDMTWEEYEEWLKVLGFTDVPGGNFHMAILPQTGQLWWPVPLLACLGLVCMLISAVCRRNAYEEE